MCSDDHIHGSGFESVEGFINFFGGLKTAQTANCHWEAGKSRFEGVCVLTHQQSGGHQHGHLLAILNGFERCAHGDFGLAIANVAGEESIHRHLRLHVFLDLFDSCQLIWSFHIGEGFFELLLPRSIWAESVSARLHAGRIELDQVDGDLAHGLAGVALGL